MVPLLVLAVLFLSTTSAQKTLTKCYGDRCFRLETRTQSFLNADQECRKLYNGHLMYNLDDDLWTNIINDMLGNTTDANAFKSTISLGIKVRQYTTELQTPNGTRVELQQGKFWNQAISTSSNERCLQASYSDWKWTLNSYCHSSYAYICESAGFSCNISKVKIDNANFDHCLTNSNVTHNTEISIHCWNEHQLKGPLNIRCIDGTWSLLPQCIPGCPPPTNRPNSKLILPQTNQLYNIGDIVTYICNDNHTIYNEDMKTHYTSTCEKNGKWSSEDCIQQKRIQQEIVEDGTTKIILECPLRSDVIAVDWVKNDIPLLNVSKYNVSLDGMLTIHYPDASDQGYYYCQQENQGYIEVADVFYQVILSDNCSKYDNDPEAEEHDLREGNSVTLRCPAEKAEVHWFKDDIPVVNSKNSNILPTGALLLRNVQLDSAGIYSCKAFQTNSKVCLKTVSYKISILAETHSICGTKDKLTFSNSTNQPWMVTLWQDDEVQPFCYGSIIEKNWIITTGFCLYAFQRKKVLNLQAEIGHGTSNQKRISISAVKVHPKYHPRLNAHDIGLAKLDVPAIGFTKSVLPICLSEADLTKKQACQQELLVNGTICGWGSLTSGNNGPSIEKMVLVRSDDCQEAGKFGFAFDMFCAKGVSPRPGFAGDMGSPFVVNKEGRSYLAGVFSWGERSAGMGNFDFFTNVAEHVDWILRIIQS